MAKLDLTTLLMVGALGLGGYFLYQENKKSQTATETKYLEAVQNSTGFSIETPLFGFTIPQKMLTGLGTIFTRIFSRDKV